MGRRSNLLAADDKFNLKDGSAFQSWEEANVFQKRERGAGWTEEVLSEKVVSFASMHRQSNFHGV